MSVPRRIWVLAVINLILGCLTVAAIVIGLMALHSQLLDRVDSRYDSCQLIRGLVTTATPKSRQAAARAYIQRTPLRDCHLYARLDGRFHPPPANPPR